MREVLPGRFAACHHPILDDAGSGGSESVTLTKSGSTALPLTAGQPSREDA